jgi:hypothetical protein
MHLTKMTTSKTIVVLFSIFFTVTRATRSYLANFPGVDLIHFEKLQALPNFGLRGDEVNGIVDVPSPLHSRVDPIVREILSISRTTTPNVYKIYFTSLAFASTIISYGLGF